MRCSRSFALVVIVGAGLAGRAQAAPVVVLEGARLIDGTGAPPRDNAALVVDGDRISAVGTAGKLARPKGARVVDLRGRTIMPTTSRRCPSTRASSCSPSSPRCWATSSSRTR